jgi:ABC-type glycerol-3-phosphate transport system substrate-binding protein
MNLKRLTQLAAVTALMLGTAQSALAANITWWVPNWDEATANQLVDEYEAANPGETVEIVITTWDSMAQQILAALSGNNPPDLISELESRTILYAGRGMLTDLTDRIDADLQRDDFIPSSLATGTFQGKLYSVPFRHDGAGLIYNKDLFTAAGLDPEVPPANWDDFIAKGKALTITDNGTTTQYGIAWPLGNLDNAVVRFLEILFDRGGAVFNEDRTQVTLDTPQAIEAMRLLTDTITVEGIAPRSSLELDNTGVRELFANKRIAMYVAGPYDAAPLREAGLNIGTAPLPGVDGIGTTTTDGFALLIPAKASNVDAAWKFAAFVGQPENQARLTASFPASMSAAHDPKFNTPDMAPFIAQLGKGVPKPDHEKWGEIQRILFDHMQSILLGSVTVEDAMAQANAEINGIM